MGKRIAYIIIFIFIWVFLTAQYIISLDGSVTVISANHRNVLSKYTGDPLYEGDSIVGEFRAREDNLGIVAIRFAHRQRIPYDLEDELVFRIKEKGAEKWYYENIYRSGLTYDVPFLPFGFEPIPDSLGKTYEFELVSLNGNKVNAVRVADRYPRLSTKYQLEKQVIFSDIENITNYIYKKFILAFDTPDVLYSSFVYSFPLLFYLFWISPPKRVLLDPLIEELLKWITKTGEGIFGRHFKTVEFAIKALITNFYTIVLLIAIAVDIFILQILNDVVYLVVVILWMFLLKKEEMRIQVTFICAIILLLIAPISLLFEGIAIAEKAASWSFMFLVIGFIQSFRDLQKSPAKK